MAAISVNRFGIETVLIGVSVMGVSSSVVV
jgi:hypothetical protein